MASTLNDQTKNSICQRFSIWTGDRLLAYDALNQQWTSEQNATQFLTYPKSGTGGTITYVEVIVDQVSRELQTGFQTKSIGMS